MAKFGDKNLISALRQISSPPQVSAANALARVMQAAFRINRSHDMPMRGELPPVTATRISAVERAVLRVVAVLSDRDLHAVAAFSTIGVLLTFNIILRFPDFGAQVAALVVFP